MIRTQSTSINYCKLCRIHYITFSYGFLIGQKYFEWKFNFTNAATLYLTLTTITEKDVIAFALNLELIKTQKEIASLVRTLFYHLLNYKTETLEENYRK